MSAVSVLLYVIPAIWYLMHMGERINRVEAVPVMACPMLIGMRGWLVVATETG